MPDPLQYLQIPGVWITGVMAIIALIMLVLRGVNERKSLEARNVRFICFGIATNSILLIMVYGAVAPDHPVSTGVSSWFALLSLVAGIAACITALVLMYEVWGMWSPSDWIDVSLFGILSTGYVTLACELYLVGRSGTSGWNGFIRKFPAVPLWVATVLIVLTVVLLAADWVPHLLSSRKKPQPPASGPTSRDQ